MPTFICDAFESKKKKYLSTSDDDFELYEKENHHYNNDGRTRSCINNRSLSYSLGISS